MQINLKLNGKTIKEEIADDLLLIDFVRKHGCYSVKRGCETANCGLCTVFLNGKPVLSCSVLTARANGQEVTTLEGLQPEAEEIGSFLAGQGASLSCPAAAMSERVGEASFPYPIIAMPRSSRGTATR